MAKAVPPATSGATGEHTSLDRLVDADAIRQLLEDFHALTGFAVSLVDLEDRFVARVGWQSICLDFHRVNEKSAELCRQSDTDMVDDLARDEVRAYRCKNGMWHVVTPLFVGDDHVGNIFTSQFFYDDEVVDRDAFAARAERFGFDATSYLAAVDAVPRHSRSTIDALMRFYARLAGQIALLGLTNIRLADTAAARERALEERGVVEARFSGLLEGAPLPMAVTDDQDRIEYVNAEFVRLFGYEVADIPTVEDWVRIAYADDAARERARSNWRAASEAAHRGTKGGDPREYTIVCKDGAIRTVTISNARVGDRMVVALNDITERKRAEEALALSEAKFATAYRTSPDSVNLNRLADGLYLEINEGFTKLSGYSEEDVRGKTSAEIAIWADPKDRDRLIAGLKADGVVTNLEAQFRRKDGTLTTALMSARIMDVNGEPAILSVTRDISDRKHSEFLLAESQRAARVGHYEWDIVHDRWDSSPVMKEIFGIDDTYTCDLQGFLQIVHPEERDALGTYVAENVVAKRQPFDREYRIVRIADGAERWVHGLGKLEHDDAGAPVLLFGVIQDITERKEAERSIRESAAQLERMVYEVAGSMGRIVEARDPYTQGHQQRVAELATRIGRRMGWSEAQLDELEMCGLLHDVGKLRIPAEILTKPGQLSAVEFELIREHPTESHEILSSISFPWQVAEIALQHHERMDGSGYPRGLGGDDIHPAARVLAVADVVEAMASHRPYRPAFAVEEAIAEVRDHPTAYDADVVAAVVALHESGELGL